MSRGECMRKSSTCDPGGGVFTVSSVEYEVPVCTGPSFSEQFCQRAHGQFASLFVRF